MNRLNYFLDSDLKAKDYYLSEFVLRDFSLENEVLFNNGADLTRDKTTLLKQYTELEHLYHNLHSTKLSKEEKDRIRVAFRNIKKLLSFHNIKDLDGDDTIYTLGKYLKSRHKNNKVVFYFEKLGLTKKGKVTEIGVWLSRQLVKYPNFKFVTIDDDNLDDVKDALISLYGNGVEIISNSILNAELDKVKLHNN